MSGWGNAQSGKCLSGEMSGRGSLHRLTVRLGNCPFRKISIGEMSVGEVPVCNLSSGKCHSGNFPHTIRNQCKNMGNLGGNPKMQGVTFTMQRIKMETKV